MIELAWGDITSIEVDAIVNAANSRLIPGGGVDAAINAAGGPSIAEEMAAIGAEIGSLETGRAVHTGAGKLPARHVIHTVGPIWGQVDEEEALALLGSCYLSSLNLAANLGCRSIAFPNISTGVYGFPKDLAAEVAVQTVRRWSSMGSPVVERIVFVCFDEENHRIYEGLLGL